MAFLPAFVPPSDETGGTFVFNPWPAINYADSVHKASLDKIQNCINGCVHQCTLTANLCQACVSGCVDRNMEVIEAIVAKKDAKVENNLIGIIGGAYGVAVNYGYTMPTPQELIQHKAQQLMGVKAAKPPGQQQPSKLTPPPPPGILPTGNGGSNLTNIDPSLWYIVNQCGKASVWTGQAIIQNSVPQPYTILEGPFPTLFEAVGRAGTLNQTPLPKQPGCPDGGGGIGGIDDLLNQLGDGENGGDHDIGTEDLFICPDGTLVAKPEDCKGAVIEHDVPDCPAPVVNCPPPVTNIQNIVNVPPCTPPPPPPDDGSSLTGGTQPPSDIALQQEEPGAVASSIVHGPGFCETLGALRSAFSSLGQSLRSGAMVSPIAIYDLAVATKLYPNTFLKELKTHFSEIASWKSLQILQDGYIGTIASIVNSDVIIVANLMAVRKWLEYLGSVEMGTDGTAGVHVEEGLSLSWSVSWLGFSLGASHDNKVIADRKYSNKSGMNPVIIPLLDLLDRLIKSAMPTGVPSTDEAIAMFLANGIDKDHFRCLVELNGDNFEEAYYQFEASRSKLNIDDSIQLLRRGVFDENLFKQYVRMDGWIADKEIEHKIELSWLYPGPQDIVRFMLRDVDDDTIVNKFGLDDEFERKFGGTLQQWAVYAGVPEDVMKYHWRAHWKIPSPQMLFEMLHRLRPEKPDVQQKNATVTIEDVNIALGQDDWLPYWQPRLTEISYRPFTRVDARRMYAGGFISGDQFKSTVQDQGYKPEDAELTKKWMDNEVVKQAMATDAAKAYLKYGIGEQQLRLELIGRGYSLFAITDAIGRLNDRLHWDHIAKCTDAIAKKYINGDIDQASLSKDLTGVGIVGSQAADLIGRLNCQMKHKEKSETGSQLCEWYQNGLITPGEFATRLVNIGYDSDNATRIVTMCQIKAAEKILKQQQKLAKETQTAIEKAKKEQEKAIKEAEKAAEKTQKIQDAFLKAAYKRQQDIMDVAARVSRLNGTAIDYEASQIGSVVFGFLANPEASQDEVYGAVEVASKALPSSGPVDFPEMIRQAYKAEIESPLYPPPVPAGNGEGEGGIDFPTLR